MATGLPPWEAMLALMEAGVPQGAFPLLDRIPARRIFPHADVDAAVRTSKFLATSDPVAAQAALYAYLMQRDVPGHLDLQGLLWATALPAGLRVDGSLILRGSAVASLPEGLRVGLSLMIDNTPMVSLPAGLVVGDGLYAAESQLASLQADLVVGGNLTLRRCPLETLPDGLVLPRTLDLSGSAIQTLPRGLKVDGSVHLQRCHQWDGHIPEDAAIRPRIHTDGAPKGVSLKTWRQRFPHGERP
jgi:hypothetical protein